MARRNGKRVPRSDLVKDSRYSQGGEVEVLQSRLGWWERRIFEMSVLDVPITISRKYDKRPDLMAFDAYGRANLAWVLLQYNNIVDINEEFVEGKEILVPTAQRVLTEFLTKTQKVR